MRIPIISGLIDRFKNFTLVNPPKWFSQLVGFISKTGISVDSENALQVTAVFACIRILAENIAALPLSIYKYTSNGKEKASERDDYITFHDIANPEQDAFQFRQSLVYNMLLYGTGYAEIVRDGRGYARELWVIPTPYVTEKRNPDTRELEYFIRSPNGELALLKKDKVLKINWMSYDGLNALKPLKMAQEAIGLTLASQDFAAYYFKNGANVSAVVEYPEQLEDEAYKRFRDSMREAYTGLSNSARLMFLEQGAKITKMANNPSESQMVETRRFQIVEIARFYNIPPHMIMDLERATFSNIEQQSINFVTYCLNPWLVRIEKALYHQIFTPFDRKLYFFKFNVSALLRGDFKNRMEGYAIGRQNGWLNANDIRDLEDMNRISDEDGGNAYIVNGNMILIPQTTGGQQ